MRTWDEIKERCLSLAECFDAWRIYPRAALTAYFVYVYWLSDTILSWYFALPGDERSLEASGLVAGVFTAVVGFGSAMLNAYVKTGRGWSGKDVD